MNRSVALAWLAHAYTGLGLVCALLALRALGDDQPREVFLWLAVAFVIDATDGVFARRVEVNVHTPHFSGRKLDDIIDYLNFTFVPVAFMYHQDMLGAPGLVLLGFVLLASGYGFCSDAAKTEDGYFTGFPSYWNVIAFYLYLLHVPAAPAIVLVIIFALMTFWPVRYLHPTRNPRARVVSLGGGALWGLLCLWLLWEPDTPAGWVYASLLYPAWYMAYALVMHYRRSSAEA